MTTHHADPDDPVAAYAEWVETRPENLRAWLLEHMPTLEDYVPCWRLATTDGHYRLHSFHTEVDADEQHVVGGAVTCKVDHVGGPGSRLLAELIPTRVFGVPVTDLVPCGCGNFEGHDPLPEGGGDDA